MTTRNGTAARIVAYVAAHPGCTRAELLQGCGIADYRDAMPTYCTKAGLIFPAGPRGSQRYYPTAQQAAAAHERICSETKARREAKIRASHVAQNLRRMMLRRAAGARTIASEHRVKLDPGVTLSPNLKITIAAPPRERWAA